MSIGSILDIVKAVMLGLSLFFAKMSGQSQERQKVKAKQAEKSHAMLVAQTDEPQTKEALLKELDAGKL